MDQRLQATKDKLHHKLIPKSARLKTLAKNSTVDLAADKPLLSISLQQMAQEKQLQKRRKFHAKENEDLWTSVKPMMMKWKMINMILCRH